LLRLRLHARRTRGGLVVGAGLEGEQFGVEPAGGHELAVGAAFGELPVVKDGDEVDWLPTGHWSGGTSCTDPNGAGNKAAVTTTAIPPLSGGDSEAAHATHAVTIADSTSAANGVTNQSRPAH
jgi:hypothetical protein